MKIYSTLFYLLIAYFLHAQKTPAHSLSVGLKSGAATLTYMELNTAHLGLALNHQRNLGSIFSLRTDLHLSYFLPAKVVEYVNNQDIPDQSLEVDQYSFQQISLRFMPCIYHRDENFSLFLGLGGGIGYYFTNRQNLDGYYDYLSNTYDLRQDGGARTSNNFQVGFSPVLGVGFNLGPKMKGGEIEIALAYESWYRNVRDWEFSNTDGGYRGLSLTTSYRFNFNN